MIKGLSHACFVVADLGKSLAFYRDKLGLEVAFELNLNQGKTRGVYLHPGGRGFVELFQGESVPTPGNASYKHICLEVDDIEATVATLRERGVEVSDVTLGKDQTWQAWLADPDGNRIELHAYTPESWQGPALRPPIGPSGHSPL